MKFSSRHLISLLLLLLCLAPPGFAGDSGEYRGLARKGDVLMSQGKLKEAEKSLLAASKIAKVAGPLYSFYAESLIKLGQLYDRKKEVEKSFKYYDEALKIYVKAYGKSTIQAANCYQGLGEMYRHNKKYLKSIPWYSKAINVRRKTAPNHPSLADSLYGQAKTFVKLKQYSEAQPLLREVISIQEKVYGSNNKRMVKTLYDLARAYEGAGKLNMAIPSYEKVIEILKSEYGATNQRIATTYERIGSAYKRLSKYRKSELAYLKALKIREHWKDKNPAKLKRCLSSYLVVLKKQNKKEKAVAIESRLAGMK